MGSKVPAEVGDRPLSHRETWKVIATGNHCLVAAAAEFFVHVETSGAAQLTCGP